MSIHKGTNKREIYFVHYLLRINYVRSDYILNGLASLVSRRNIMSVSP